jgi:hypothetical protein
MKWFYRARRMRLILALTKAPSVIASIAAQTICGQNLAQI